MKNHILYIALLSFSKTLFAQQISDVDGNMYPTVTIGNQVWMGASLKTTRFSNGDTIPTTVPPTLDVNGEPAPLYQWSYNGDDSLAEIYGRLYTWYVVGDSRNVCPNGWHVPSSAEFDTLELFLGGSDIAGGKLKQTGYDHWLFPNTGATNETGFNGLPNGNRNLLGYFNDMGIVSDVWSSTEGVQGAWDFDLNYDNESTVSYDDPKGFAFAIRCLRNEPAKIDLSEIKIYPTVSDQFVTISSEGYYGLKYFIIGIDGKSVMQGDLMNSITMLDLSALSAGSYIVKITNASSTVEFKLVKVTK